MVTNSAADAIDRLQREIIEEFEVLGDDRESTLYYIMELGHKLDALDEASKTEENTIKGCQSKVWLVADFDSDRVFYRADSNTEITRGLIALLIRVLSGQPARDIATADLYFIDKIGMGRVIGAQRSNGLKSMIKQMKLYALAYSTKYSA